MGKSLNLLIYFLAFWKYYSLILSALYMLAWVFLIYKPEVFYYFNFFLNFFPDLFDKYYYQMSDINGIEVSMGYVYSAFVAISTTVVSSSFLKKLIKIKKIKENQEAERKVNNAFNAQRKKQEQQKKEKIENIQKISNFYGLFDLKLKYQTEYEKNPQDLMDLKKEYAGLTFEKIKKKYPNVKFIVSDKIFLVVDSFEIFPSLISDLCNIFKIFKEVDIQKQIETDLLLAFWNEDFAINSKIAIKVLSKINQLNYLNKVVISDKIVDKIKMELGECFNFVPLGTSKIDYDGNFQKGLNVDLYYIKKI